MFSSLTKGKLLGISLVLFVFVGTLSLNLSGDVTANNIRRPGDTETAQITVNQVAPAPATFREFGSSVELSEWVKKTFETFREQDKVMPPVAPKLVSTSVWDCDDYAERLQRKALSEGYLISQQLITNGSLLGAKVTNYVTDHMGNITVIGNNMYYIEPLDGHVAIIGPKD